MKTTVFEQAIRIMQCVSNRAAEGHEYSEHWGKAFRLKEIDEFFKEMQTKFKADFWNEVFRLPKEQKRLLGFLKWSSKDKGMCIPIWIWSCLPEDMVIGGNAGDKMKKDLDSDTRFGCVWWRV